MKPYFSKLTPLILPPLSRNEPVEEISEKGIRMYPVGFFLPFSYWILHKPDTYDVTCWEIHGMLRPAGRGGTDKSVV